jgi:hypothetical protein
MMREAFSMFVAIATMMIISAVTMLVSSLSGKITKETTDQYRREQAILYAKSYTELAVMAAGTNDCLEHFEANIDGSAAEVKKGQGYRVLVNIRHIGTDNTACGSNLSTTPITHSASRNSVIIVDVRVRYRDLDLIDTIQANGESIDGDTAWRTYHKRSLQRL